MKKFKFIAALATALILVPFLQSCIDDNDTAPYPWLAMTTIKTLEDVEHGYYFGLDDGSKMYPGDTTAISNYELIDGQRAFVFFDYLDEPKAGYNSNIKVGHINNILTKDIIDLTEENVEDIGDNKINATNIWIAQNYVNIEFQYYGTNNEEKKHFLNLVENTTTTENDEEGYISLEFRHNIKGDTADRLGEGYVSFKLEKIAEKMKDAKGLKIRIKTLYDGVKFSKIDFAKKEEKKVLKQLTMPINTFKTIY